MLVVDWKQVCKSPGYISLKAAMRDRNRKPSQSVVSKFKWVIGRASHYAYHQDVTLDVILNEWETRRDYCFQNFYQDHRFPKLTNSGCLVPRVKQVAFGNYSPVEKRDRARNRQESIARKKRTKKARWSAYKRSR